MRVDLMTLAAQAAGTSPPPFWERFVLSPGFGGLAALVGGLLAYLAAVRKSRDDRAKASDERAAADRSHRLASDDHGLAITAARQAEERARQERWWATLMWVYDRATVEPPKPVLSAQAAMNFLDQLLDEAKTVLEVRVVSGLLAIFTSETGRR